MRIDYQLRGGSIARMLRAMLRTTSSAAAISGAASMLLAEPQGLAIDFTDSYFFASTGRYGSAEVKDLGTPANNFDSIPGDLLTYTGTTKLTRQSDGVYRYGPHNLLIQSADPSHAAWVLTYNVSSKTTGMTDPVGGTSACRIQASTGWFHGSPCAMVAGASYNLSVWVRSRSGTQKVAMFARDGAVGSSSFTITTTWAKIEFDFTATANTTQHAGLWDSSPTNGATDIDIAFPHFRRTPSDSTYLATTSAARYGLPFEWNTSGVLQGILVEPQVTNLFLNSTTGANQTVTLATSTTYTLSFFGTGSISYSGAATGTLTGTGATDRVSVTFTSSAVVTGLVCVVSGTCTYVQIETGSVATSPIITYAASATRAADNISLATSQFPFSVATSTLFTQAEHNQNVPNPRYTAISNGGSERYIEIYGTTGSFDEQTYAAGGTFVATIGSSSPSSLKAAVALANNDGAAVVNAGTVTTDNTVTLTQSPTRLYVGQYGGGSNFCYGHIKKIMYLPRRMSNAELQTVTT